MSVALVSQIQACQHILSALLDKAENFTKEQIERMFVFSLVWSLGALLTNKDRKSFSGNIINKTLVIYYSLLILFIRFLEEDVLKFPYHKQP